MAHLVALTPSNTYATPENASKAVEKKFPSSHYPQLTYFIQPHRAEGETDWRYFPVFIGERAIQAMVHFHFNVVA